MKPGAEAMKPQIMTESVQQVRVTGIQVIMDRKDIEVGFLETSRLVDSVLDFWLPQRPRQGVAPIRPVWGNP